MSRVCGPRMESNHSSKDYDLRQYIFAMIAFELIHPEKYDDQKHKEQLHLYSSLENNKLELDSHQH